MHLTTTVLADDPGLVDPMWAMDTTWPEFMRHDPIGGRKRHPTQAAARPIVPGTAGGTQAQVSLHAR